MLEDAVVILTGLAAIGSGVMAGFFFAFSNTVMAALGRQPPAAGMAAMQAVNVVVLNPLFFVAFFGTAALCLLLLVASIVLWSEAGALLLLSACLAYLIGCIGVTMACNVPLNNTLAAVKPGMPEADATWARYLDVWTGWNHVRTVACAASAALFTMTLM